MGSTSTALLVLGVLSYDAINFQLLITILYTNYLSVFTPSCFFFSLHVLSFGLTQVSSLMLSREQFQFQADLVSNDFCFQNV